MKRTIAVGALCACLGVAAGSAFAQGKAPHPKLLSALANLEAGLLDLGSAPADAEGHLKKSQELARKSIDELREAMGASHTAHSHDEAPAKKKK